MKLNTSTSYLVDIYVSYTTECGTNGSTVLLNIPADKEQQKTTELHEELRQSGKTVTGTNSRIFLN